MAVTTPHVDLALMTSRHLPMAASAEVARVIAASGQVDSVTVWDQLTFLIPHALWREEYTALAASLPDIDSFPDPWSTMGYLAGAAPGLGLTTSTDAVRRGPAEMMQAMLSVANLTEGRMIVQIGAGEAKQATPFGHCRTDALRRLEDHLRLYRAFESTEPVDFDGNVWKFDRAWLGSARQHLPRVFALGGGPKLLDIATSHADGYVTLFPGVWSSVQEAAAQVARLRGELERKGRDPSTFVFGVWVAALLHESDAVIAEALDGPYLRWLTATLGRINPNDWDDKEGIPSPMPRDWHYANDMLPVNYTLDACREVTARVTEAMTSKSWVVGTPTRSPSRSPP
jgi:phthiodiolone/phenolphthiodiolone dimycocerosates ketoreductase